MRCTATTSRRRPGPPARPHRRPPRSPRARTSPELGTGYHRPVDLVVPGDSAAEAGRITLATVQMNLLLDEVDVLEVSGAPASVPVTTIEHDSRRVTPGALFCCLPGRHSDGHDHAAEAVARGAVALVCERLVAASLSGGGVQARVW